MIGLCVACGYKRVIDRAHIKSKGAGGTWDEDNIIHLCRQHHQEQHQIGWPRFVEKYVRVERELDNKGWIMEVQFGVKRLIRK
jgi:hypothetical protein